MKRVVILTGNDLRHQFFRKKIALTPGIEVARSYCETGKQVLSPLEEEPLNTLRDQHLKARLQSETDFFDLYVTYARDISNAVLIENGSINNPQYTEEIYSLNIDLIIVYGSSILKPPLLNLFPGRILNVHLGLSPYYRGSATNYWPLVDSLPECVGATFMYIDEGIDTGEVIHQIRPEMCFFDTPSSIGNRLIKQMTGVYARLIIEFDNLKKNEPVEFNPLRKLCKRKDYTEASVQKLYANFSNGMINKYLATKAERDNSFPIITNKNDALSFII